MVTADNTASALWAPQRRNCTVGLVLVVTLAAFEAMGIATALPTIVRELHGERWYSWPFTVFMAASAIATVLAGRAADRRGPAVPLLLAMPAFAVGLVVAGLATDMTTLLIARALQGLGGGGQVVALYVLIARVYPDEHRPAAFGAVSAAWVVPALVGPVVAGLLTEHLSWRWVFLGLSPLVGLGAALLAPTVRRFGARAQDAPAGRRGLPVAALGAALGVVTLTWAAQNPSSLSLLLATGALVVLLPCLRVLVPVGVRAGHPGIPVMVLARGSLAGIFFSAQAFVPLTLSVVHHYSPATAGVPLTLGSLGWSAGAFWQSRQRKYHRHTVVAAGFLLVGAGILGLTAIAFERGPHWIVFLSWFVAGGGMGIAIASTAVRVLALSPTGERGFNSAALQISDMLGQAALIGFAGVLVATLATAASPTSGVLPLDLLLACAAVVAAQLIRRRGGSTGGDSTRENPNSPP